MISADVGYTLGFGQMHEQQQEAFMDLVSMALMAASHCGDQEIMDRALDTAHEAVRIFGGPGIFKDDS